MLRTFFVFASWLGKFVVGQEIDKSSCMGSMRLRVLGLRTLSSNLTDQILGARHNPAAITSLAPGIPDDIGLRGFRVCGAGPAGTRGVQLSASGHGFGGRVGLCDVYRSVTRLLARACDQSKTV